MKILIAIVAILMFCAPSFSDSRSEGITLNGTLAFSTTNDTMFWDTAVWTVANGADNLWYVLGATSTAVSYEPLCFYDTNVIVTTIDTGAEILPRIYVTAIQSNNPILLPKPRKLNYGLSIKPLRGRSGTSCYVMQYTKPTGTSY